MAALRGAGSLSKWSDHATIEITVRYTDTVQAKPRWAMPLHVLHDEAIVNALRGRANTAAAGGDGTAGPVDRLFTFITDSIEYVQTCVKEKTERHRKHKQP